MPGCDGTDPPDDRQAIRRNPELGITGAAQWAAIVDEPTWRAAVRIPCDPSRRTPAKGGKGLLTGVAVCDEPGHRGGAAHRKPMYRCRSSRHVSRLARPVDDYVIAVTLDILKRPDAAMLWSAELPDADELMAEADTLRRRRDDLALDYADGAMTREQFRAANERALGRLADIESKIAAAGSTSPLSIVAAEDVEATWSGLSVAARPGIIAALCTPVLHVPGRETRTFRPETVTFRWHHENR